MAENKNRFPAGTFRPAPQPSETSHLIAAQAKMEALLIARHGEQLLLTLFIPMALLVGLSVVPVLDSQDPVRDVFPMVLAVAAMSAGFTGQAIAVGFDRRYGALKRIGASGLPRWGIIAGKCSAVAIIVAGQFFIFAAAAALLGFSAPFGAWILAFIATIVGAGVFTSMGLLMGGTLSAELILALANLIWFVLVGAASLVAVGPELSSGVEALLKILPSTALTELIAEAFACRVDYYALVVLLLWGGICGALAIRFFSFESRDE